MRLWTQAAAAVVLGMSVLAGAAAPVCATPTSVKKEIRDDLRQALAAMAKESPEKHLFLDKLKKAGASYFPELLAPADQVSRYQDNDKRRQMVGVYLVDMSYAAVFEKKKDSLRYAQDLDGLLTELGYNDKKVVAQYQKALKDFNGPQSKKIFKDLDRLIVKSWSDILGRPGGLELAVDASYGWCIEMLYLTGEIAAQKNYDPKFLGFLSEQEDMTRTFTGILEVFKNEPTFAELVERDERLTVLQEISAKLKNPGQITQQTVDEVRVVVTKARVELMK
ncbi:MAG: hypothetical protein PHU21_04740 [Elusimicrobia bacterium]|nr:hypothetical protein [Elusimicrobiota bacterium]